MPKFILLTLLALLASAALAACGGGSGDATPPTSAATQPTEPASTSGEPAEEPLADLATRLEEEGLAVTSDQPGDAEAAMKAGPVKIAEYGTAREAKAVEREISEIFSGDEISGEGRVALVGDVLVYVADEHELSRSKEAAFETVVAALEASE